MAQNYWDAGDIGCGELIIELKKRMTDLKSGEIFEVRSTDLGAKEDLPAWANLTNNKLIKEDHPNYFFKKK